MMFGQFVHVSDHPDTENYRAPELPKVDGMRHMGYMKTTGERIVILGHRETKNTELFGVDNTPKHEVLVLLFERLSTGDQADLLTIISSAEGQKNDYLIGDPDRKDSVLAGKVHRGTGDSWEQFLLKSGIRMNNAENIMADGLLQIVEMELVKFDNEHQRLFFLDQAPAVNVEMENRKKAAKIHRNALEKLRRGEPLDENERAAINSGAPISGVSKEVEGRIANLENTISQLTQALTKVVGELKETKEKEAAKPARKKPGPKPGTKRKKTTATKKEEPSKETGETTEEG